MEIIEKLNSLGLKGKEAPVYMALLKLQKANAHQIAQEAGVERTTVYSILEELILKGLAIKSPVGKRLVYILEHPVKLKQMLERQQNMVEQMLPALLALNGSNTARPIVKFYEDVEGIKKVLMNSLEAKEKLRRDFASVENIVDFLGLRFINNQIRERVKRGIKVLSLRSVPSGSKISEKDWFLRKDNNDLLREVRFTAKSFSFSALISIYDNRVAIISSKKESYALEIESRELSQALKTLFDIAWEQADKG